MCCVSGAFLGREEHEAERRADEDPPRPIHDVLVDVLDELERKAAS